MYSAVVGSLLAAMAAMALPRGMWADAANHDVTWTIAAGQRLAAGGQVGVDVIDVNPPLIYWLAGAVTWLADLVSADPLLVWVAATALMGGLAALALRRWSLVAGVDSGHAAALALVVGAAVLPLTGFDIGQRDHLVAVALVALCGRMASVLSPLSNPGASSNRGGWLFAAIVALALALKPHYALAWLGACALTLKKRRFVELFAGIAVAVLYVAAIATWAPQWWQAA